MTLKEQYDKDFYGWAMANAALLKQGKVSEVDMDHLIEEVESMGKSEKRELKSCLTILMAHLLKWQYQPEKREVGHSWECTINEQRKNSTQVLEENPSLKHKLDETLINAYDSAISRAARETGLKESEFPEQCPYTFEQLMDRNFLPE